MKRYGRIETLAGPKYCEIDDDWLWILDGAPWWSGSRRTDDKRPLTGVKWLAPSDASKVVAVGQNYRDHAKEMGKEIPEEPRIFIKPSTALNGHESPIVLPPESNDVQHEAELGLIIGRRSHRADLDEAKSAIFAVTCFNDVTARDIQKREIQHARAKGYDTVACCGPYMVTGLDSSDLEIIARVDGEVRQRGRSSNMVFSPAHLVSFMSKVMTLLPGDIISTGTPAGVGTIRAGQTVEIEIENVGVLRNPVRGLS